MTAIALVQSFVSFESLVSSVVAFLSVLGLSVVTDFWGGTATHRLPDNGSAVSSTSALPKSPRITYGTNTRITYGKPAQ